VAELLNMEDEQRFRICLSLDSLPSARWSEVDGEVELYSSGSCDGLSAFLYVALAVMQTGAVGAQLFPVCC